MDLAKDILFYFICLVNPIIIIVYNYKDQIIRFWAEKTIPKYPKYKFIKSEDFEPVSKWIFRDSDNKIILIYSYNMPHVFEYFAIGEVDTSDTQAMLHSYTQSSSITGIKTKYYECINGKDNFNEINYILDNYERWKMENVL